MGGELPSTVVAVIDRVSQSPRELASSPAALTRDGRLAGPVGPKELCTPAFVQAERMLDSGIV